MTRVSRDTTGTPSQPVVPDEQVALAVSYLRVSSGRQVGGDRAGLDRQADAFRRFCDRHQLRPAPDAVVDAGVSAFHGRHRRRGGLAAFIAAAEDGRFPPGSVLVVEDLDRFSREAASHQQALLLRLFDAGLALGIVRDDRVVDRATYDADLGLRVMFAVRQDAAHDYSAKLSGRLADVWQRRRSSGKPYPAAAPFWLTWTGTGFTLNDLVVIPQRIVELSIAGHGLGGIARILNDDGHRTPRGRLFTHSYVRKVVNDPAIIGVREWRQGGEVIDTVPGYFPAAVTEAEWRRCHDAIARRDDRRGAHGKGKHLHNLFQGRLHCRCGELLSFHRSKGIEYLRCAGKRKGTCTEPPGNVAHYDEEWILRRFMATRWADLFRAPSRTNQRHQLRQQILQADAELARLRQQARDRGDRLAQLLDSGDLNATVANRLGQQVEQAETAAQAAQDQRQRLQEQLDDLDHQQTGAAAQAAIRQRVADFMATGRHDVEQRRAFNAWLGTLDVRLTLDRGPRLVVDRDGEGVELHTDETTFMVEQDPAAIQAEADHWAAVFSRPAAPPTRPG